MPDNSTPSTSVRRRKAPRPDISIIKVTVEKTDRNLLVRLPSLMADYLKLGETTSLYATSINGVVQLAGFQPNIAIPVARISEDDFVELEED